MILIEKVEKSTWRLLRNTAIFAVICASPIVIFFGVWVVGAGGSDDGSPELAAEWRELLSTFPDPDTATEADERIWMIQCDNGEWLFGLAQCSHGAWRCGGGTVVTKDSDGELRSFCGHVCASVGSPFPGPAEDLPALYQQIEEIGFKTLVAKAGGE